MAGRFVIGLDEVGMGDLGLVGGKGAQLGELSRIDDIDVPAGFCVTTDAFQQVMALAPGVEDQLDHMMRLAPDDRAAIVALSGQVRAAIEAVAVPDDVVSAITGASLALGDQVPCAVRSSATAEDLPTASFAGQQDTYLNVVGTSAIVEHVSRCWASLFTERAVTYRLRNGFDHRAAQMAVVVQRMVDAHSSGVLFTADPVTSNRTVASVEATLGLGEALVSGLVNAQVYSVGDDGIVTTTFDPETSKQRVLTDEQVLQLVHLGRRIEAHFGRPQDIEWCLDDTGFHIVQSRPITTLFPIPHVDDSDDHVYISVGHQQMMTDPIKPLGLSVWQLTALRPMYHAGGRLFVDVAAALASPAMRAGLLDAFAKSDPLIRDALQAVVDRGDIVPTAPDTAPSGPPPGAALPPIETDPTIVDALIASWEASIAVAQREIVTRSGPDVFDFILTDIRELQRLMTDTLSQQATMAGIEATWWLNDHLDAWLAEKNAADVLTQSAPHNVTSEMGLALLDVADVIRPHPQVVSLLRRVDDDSFLDEMPALAGGDDSRDAIVDYLDRYGMRCVGEIDITRPRWAEHPSALVPVILGNVDNVAPGEAARRFERGRHEAQRKEHEVLDRLRALPDGDEKAADTKRMIDRLRTFIGYREYPKYGMVSRYLIYKQALMREADRLVAVGALRDRDDIAYLTFDELRDVAQTHSVDDALIEHRKESFRSHAALTPPRVLTSDGEVVAGSYHRDDVPTGGLVGLAVSAGIVEGRARVVLDMADADLEPGDILVTAHTDPSWSPLFVSIAGLVTEVGGLMTHGAVITREYGLPAVVGVEHATRLIADGQHIRVNGTDGYVEILPSPGGVSAAGFSGG